MGLPHFLGNPQKDRHGNLVTSPSSPTSIRHRIPHPAQTAAFHAVAGGKGLGSRRDRRDRRGPAETAKTAKQTAKPCRRRNCSRWCRRVRAELSDQLAAGTDAENYAKKGDVDRLRQRGVMRRWSRR